MNVQLSYDQHSFLAQLVDSGRYPSTDAALAAGIDLLKQNEALRDQIAVGIEQADAGDLVDHDSLFERLRVQAAQAANDQ